MIFSTAYTVSYSNTSKIPRQNVKKKDKAIPRTMILAAKNIQTISQQQKNDLWPISVHSQKH